MKDIQIGRRKFLQQSAVISVGFLSLARCANDSSLVANGAGKLKIIQDPKGFIDLPEGFTYKVISRAGQKMSDGFLVPGRPDGMGAFLNEAGQTVIIRNHENSPTPVQHSPFIRKNQQLSQLVPNLIYDAGYGTSPGLGGTTTFVYDEASGEVTDQYLSLIGTYRNCAGGVTPWGTWLTCEEDVTQANGKQVEKDHGYVFEVPFTKKGLTPPIPITAMGRFMHEAVAVDPKSGIVYQTEDRGDGLIYRYLPNEKGNLLAGGQLQVMAIKGHQGMDTRNWENRSINKGEEFQVTWLDIDQVAAPDDDLRYRGFALGAARFARGEGMWMGDGELFFACTNGGPKKLGQVFRYQLSPQEGNEEESSQMGTLVLFAESEDKSVLHMCDNLTIAPWGDVILCEDNGESNHIRGINKQGELYTFACNRASKSEFAGLVFSPSGKTLFVNIQEGGETVAISGPWSRLFDEFPI